MATSKKASSPATTFASRRTLWLFAVAALVLVPWTMWLSRSLPPTHVDRRWDIAWSGLDIGEFISLAITAYLGLRKSGWIIVTASIAGTLLLVDAWFDSLTATVGWEYLASLLSAVFAELPLSILAFWVAYRVGKRLF
ncbi:MAG TPA: hypothetical protein VJP80_06490 [Candidatus Saccharimonadales bacterium]|nr:hypothetical protein [Candidatus Saccharimonadales bacterium]